MPSTDRDAFHRWRHLTTPPASGAHNMALDELLMAVAIAHDTWVLRVYGWSSPTLSFGKNQTAKGSYSPERLRERGVDVVRRPTGGRAILHHREITYSVAAPLTRAGTLRDSYGAINRVLLAALQRLGVPAALSGTGPRGIPPGIIPCFDHPSVGEIIVGPRKLVGSAQWRSANALLQHGSILIDDDQGMVNDFLFESVEAPAAPPAAATLREVLRDPPSLDEMSTALVGVVSAECVDTKPLPPDAIDRAAFTPILERFESGDWTWRR
jgi:lipoate-protein ligase A